MCEFWIHQKQELGSLCLTSQVCRDLIYPGTSNALASDSARERQFWSGVPPRVYSGFPSVWRQTVWKVGVLTLLEGAIELGCTEYA